MPLYSRKLNSVRIVTGADARDTADLPANYAHDLPGIAFTHDYQSDVSEQFFKH